MKGGGARREETIRESLWWRLERRPIFSVPGERPAAARRLSGTAAHCGASCPPATPARWGFGSRPAPPPPAPAAVCRVPPCAPRPHPRAAPGSGCPCRVRCRASITREPLTHTRALPARDSSASPPPAPAPAPGSAFASLAHVASDANALPYPTPHAPTSPPTPAPAFQAAPPAPGTQPALSASARRALKVPARPH